MPVEKAPGSAGAFLSRTRRAGDFVGSSGLSPGRPAGHVAAMAEHAPSFVAECYWPDVREEDVRTLDQRIAASLADDVHYLGSVLIREDEVVLCHFEGTADAIRLVAEQARVPYERLLATTVSVRTDYTPLQGRSSK